MGNSYVCLFLSLELLSTTLAFESFTMTSGYGNYPYIGFRQVINSVGSPDLVRDLGTFRVTKPGVYFLTFTALSDPKGFRISLRRNRVPAVTGFADAGGYKTVTLNVVLKLNRGDVIYPYIEDGNIYESPLTTQRAYTAFSAILLQNESSFFGLMGRSANGTMENPDEPQKFESLQEDNDDRIYEELAKTNN